MTEIKGDNDNHLNQKKILKRLTCKRQFVFSPAGENSKRYPVFHPCYWDILHDSHWICGGHFRTALSRQKHLQVRSRQEVVLAGPFWLSPSCWHRQPFLTVFSNSSHSQKLMREDTGRGGLQVRSLQQCRQQSPQKFCIMTYIHLTVLWFSGPISQLYSCIHELSEHTSHTFIKMQHYPQITKHIPKLESISPN